MTNWMWAFAQFGTQIYQNRGTLPEINSLLEPKIMFRVLGCSAAIVALFSIGTLTALAQSAPPKPKYPGLIAAASRILAEKNESCRLQAKQQGLHFLKRRRFMRECRAAP
jgi:hypothetical protein